MKNMLLIFLVCLLCSYVSNCNVSKPLIVEKLEDRYLPTWDSLDTRPLPSWYDEAKVGIFLHWGVFSVPSFKSEWFWNNWKGNDQSSVDFINNNYPPNFSYQEFAKDFTAEFFNPDEWAQLFKNSGAKYVVLTSKHHEGYTLWPSKYSFSWNALDIGPHRDLIKDLSESVRAANLTFGLYHSLYEWFNPEYLADKNNSFQTTVFSGNKIIPEMIELIENYKPDVLWSDGDWEAPDTYWNSTEFLAWLYNDSPVRDTVVTNDRWGQGVMCNHGDFYTCADRYNPGVLLPHKWENAMTIDKQSWGYRRNAQLSDFLTIEELISQLAGTVSCGGNILINVGPTKEGTIVPIFQERLLNLGKWLSINGDAIYSSSPWSSQNDTHTENIWYTAKGNNVYAIVLNWPPENVLQLASVNDLFSNSTPTAVLLGNEDTNLEWTINDSLVSITFPDLAKVKSQWSWVITINSN